MRILLLIYIFLLSAPSLMAQFSLGVSSGVTLSQQDWRYAETFDRNTTKGLRIGYNASVFADLKLSPRASIQVGAGYYQKGFREVIDVASPLIDNNYTLTTNNYIDYAHFFSNLKWRLERSGGSPYLLVGFDHNVRMGKEAHDLYKYHFQHFQRWNESATAGFGYEGGSDCWGWFAQVQYHYDLNFAFHRNGLKIYNHAYDLRVGILIRDFNWFYRWREG